MFWQNHAELAPWEDALRARTLPVARGLTLDLDDQIRRTLIERLMCDGRVELAAIDAAFDISSQRYFANELARIGSMSDLASYDVERNSIQTTRLGRLLVRNVCMVFDRYHQTNAVERRFSSTI